MRKKIIFVVDHHPDDHLVAVIRLPHIANFNDIDPLLHLKGLNVHFLNRVCDLDKASAVIIPGSKNTRADLIWLHREHRKDLAFSTAHGLRISLLCFTSNFVFFFRAPPRSCRLATLTSFSISES